MDFEEVDILTSLKINEFEARVAVTASSKTEYTNIERSEALETLGIAQFYNGNYSDAVINLEKSISSRYIKLKSKKRVMVIKTLLGSLYYRFGDLHRAEQMFTAAGDSCKKLHDNVMLSTNLSNLAIVQIRQENAKDALRNARSSVDLLQKIYSKKCLEYLQAVRVMISVFLKLEEFSKAESLVEEHEFSVREKVLILAGIKFAQSDYSAATVILTKYAQQEADLLHGAKAPSLGAIGPAGSTADLQNPWSKWSGTPGGPNAGAGAGPAAGLDAGVAPTPKHSSLIQPTRSYMDDLNNEVLSTMVKYNIALMKNKSTIDLDLSSAIDQLERFNKQIVERRVSVNNKAARTQAVNAKASSTEAGPLSQDDPYLDLAWDKHPNFMPFDAYMFPAVALSVMLSAQSEFSMLTTPLTQGMSIEAGNITSDVTGMDLVLRQIQQEYKNAHAALYATLPTTAEDSSAAKMISADYKGEWNSEEQFEEPDTPHTPQTPQTSRPVTPGTGRFGFGPEASASASASASALNSARGAPSTARSGRDSPTGGVAFEDSVVSEETSHLHSHSKSVLNIVTTEEGQLGEMQEIPDLAEAKYATQRFQILKDLVSCTIGTDEIAELAQKRLKEEHRVHVDNETGKIMTHREIGNLQNQAKSVRGGKLSKSARRPTSSNLAADSDDSAAKVAAQSQVEAAKLSAEAAAGPGEAEQKVMNAAPAITYKVSKQSGGTLQSDLLPLVQTFGKDQATLWIEWALSKASTMSFGFLGQSCLDPLPDVGFNLKKKPATGLVLDNHDDEVLGQVRSRLLELETMLSNPSENSKVTSVRGVRLESRVINFLLLAKVTVQLNMKKEAGQCILQLEEVCAGLRRQQCDSLDSLVYHSFALRFRMDYEEWCISQLVSDAWLLSHLINKVLPLCKQYLAVCRQIGDAVLQRDALKRMINLYSEVGNIAASDDSDALVMTKERIQLLSTVELDAYELNIEWVQRNGVSRALIMYEEMRKIGANASS